MMDNDVLKGAVEDKSETVYMNYEQLKDYYQDKYGARGWIGAMAQSATGSSTRSGKAYSAARRTIERHESGQYKDFQPSFRAKLEQVSQKEPPVDRRAPGGSITVTVSGTQSEKGGARERSFTVTLTGSDAYDFVNDPSYRILFKQLGYPDWLIDRFDGGDSSALDVTSVS